MDNKSINENLLESLLAGDRQSCSQIIGNTIKNNVSVEDIYEKNIKIALYEIGDLWERGKISVATEHLASAIIESILNELYSGIISQKRTNKTIVAASLENETHQIGIKMVADIFEMHGWNVHFLGANVPAKEMTSFVENSKPDLIALSMSIYFHLPQLENMIKTIRECCSTLPIIVGGQGFRFWGDDVISHYPNVVYLNNLYTLDLFIENFNYHGQKHTY